MTRLPLTSLACALALIVPAFHAVDAHAEGKKDKAAKEETKEDAAAVDAFFDAPVGKDGKKSSMDALTEAASGVASKEKKKLTPKAAVVDDNAKVKVFGAFVAEKILIDKKKGCEPAGREKKKITFMEFDEVPAEGVPFAVCLTMQSKAGREMGVSVAIMDPRNLRVAKAEDVVDFRARTERLDHVMDFPAPVFKTAGQYHYVVEIDGKEIARVPLFEVRIVP